MAKELTEKEVENLGRVMERKGFSQEMASVWQEVAKSAAALRSFDDTTTKAAVDYWTEVYRENKTEYNKLTGRSLPLNW